MSLQESCSVVSKLDLMITDDSDLMHVVNALETPLIAIYGPTDYSRTTPLAKTSKVIKSNYSCMPILSLRVHMILKLPSCL